MHGPIYQINRAEYNNECKKILGIKFLNVFIYVSHENKLSSTVESQRLNFM